MGEMIWALFTSNGWEGTNLEGTFDQAIDAYLRGKEILESEMESEGEQMTDIYFAKVPRGGEIREANITEEMKHYVWDDDAPLVNP